MNANCAPLTRARAPIGVRHEPSSASRKARSASISIRASLFSHFANASSTRASSLRAVIAIAPWHAAGGVSCGSTRLAARLSKPIRFKPASAKKVASASPASSFASLVSTFPRKTDTRRSRRANSTCAWRRRLAVPTFAPAGNAASVCAFKLTNASRGSSRSGTHASTMPSGKRVGRSFKEWIARSMRPSNSASSSSFVNSPLPPASISVRSWMRSPLVTIGTMSNASSRSPRIAAKRARVWPVCASDSFEPRAPMRKSGALMLLHLNAGAGEGNAPNVPQ